MWSMLHIYKPQDDSPYFKKNLVLIWWFIMKVQAHKESQLQCFFFLNLSMIKKIRMNSI